MIEEYRMALEQYEKKETYLWDSSSPRGDDHRNTIKELGRYFKEVENSASQRKITRSMARSQYQDDSLALELQGSRANQKINSLVNQR
jgi:hypothetical protein